MLIKPEKNISCLSCRKEFNSRAFHTHDQRMHLKTQTNYTGKTAKAVKVAVFNAKKRANIKEELYNLDPVTCGWCHTPIDFKKFSKDRRTKFCGSACAAHNSHRERKKSKWINPKKKSAEEKRITNSIYRKLRKERLKTLVCKICNTQFSVPQASSCQTCSPVCKSLLISKKVRGKTGGSTKQYIRYFDSDNTECYLDSLWELKLANVLDKHGVAWNRPKSFLLSRGRRYTPDFFLIDYNVYLDPKAKRTGYIKNLEKISQFEKEFDVKCLVITNYDLLCWYHIQTMLIVGTNRS